MTEMTKKPTAMTLRARIESPAFAAEIAKVLPGHLTPHRMVRVAATTIMRTPKLAECDQVSFCNAMLTLSQLGLEPDGRNAHLIPFRNNKTNKTECQLIIDYKGLVELMMRTGNVASIHADKVCENDDFEVDLGQITKHKVDYRKPRGDAYAYYAIVTRRDGGKKCEVMTRDEVDAIRRRSKSASIGPWVTDYDEMAKKTVFKRASKWCELSPEIRDAIREDDRDTIEGQAVRTTIEAGDLSDMLTLPEAEVDAETSPPGALFESAPDAANV